MIFPSPFMIRKWRARVQNFVDEYREDTRALEEAYTGSRYLAGVYVEEDASEAIRVVENLFKILEVIEDNVFS
ncbi:hypothetical protein TCARB_0972 [Thermofilum adornatum 1505]|uniref:HEPN domain-containing protein n=2 Tax=Thermofilum adornatum TaxID=1365176 RepID=A0A3G1A5G1_9CREN|nr:hypothetical protein TCARB_0972 [Thermofilum adornatum 1505]